MQTKKITAFSILILSLVFFGCSKQQADQPAQPGRPVKEPPKQLVKISYPINPVNIIDFTYDEQGRLIDMNGAYQKIKYLYTNNLVSFNMVDQNNYTYAEFKNGKLDSEGRLVYVEALYKPKNLPAYNDQFLYTYNAEGFLIKSVRTSVATQEKIEYVYNYTNGNLTSVDQIFHGSPGVHIEFTYYDNLTNYLTIDLGKHSFWFFSDGLSGKRSKNLVKTETNYTPQHVKITDYVFQYDLDAQGFPTKFNCNDLVINFAYDTVLEYNK